MDITALVRDLSDDQLEALLRVLNDEQEPDDLMALAPLAEAVSDHLDTVQ